jgi:glutamine amidotransferase
VTRIAVIDHGAGNLVSIAQGLERAGATTSIALEPGDLSGADAVVLPGVGATGAAMRTLRSRALDRALVEWNGPLLGICVGLQLFFSTSDEDGGSCLGLIDGTVAGLVGAPRLPQIGWNDLTHTRRDPIFEGIADDATFYFVHSYAPVPVDQSVVLSTAEYGSTFVAAVRDGRRVGVQFHPERSGSAGLRLLANFVSDVQGAA